MSLSDEFPWLKGSAAIWEPAVTVATGIAGEIPAGFYGLYETARTGDPAAGAQAVQDLQDQYTYLPRSEEGMAGLQALGRGMESAMNWRGLLDIPGTSANELMAQFQTHAGRLGAAPAAILEGLLAAGPPIPAKAGGVLSIADRASDQANKLRKIYEVEYGSSLDEGALAPAIQFDDLWHAWWDELDPEDVGELRGKMYLAEKGGWQKSLRDRMDAAATVASAYEAGAPVPPQWIDTVYKAMMENPSFAKIVDSPLSSTDLKRVNSQRRVDAMEEAFDQYELRRNPQETFGQKRLAQKDAEDLVDRTRRLDNYSDQDYLDALDATEKTWAERRLTTPENVTELAPAGALNPARESRLLSYTPPIEGKLADQPLLDLPDPRSATGPMKSTLGKALAPLSRPGVRARERLRQGGETIINESERARSLLLEPEELLGRVLVPVAGDRTRAGGRLQQVRGVPLEGALELEGGPGFAEQHAGTGAAWASMKPAAASKQANITKAALETGADPVGVYTAMSPEGSNFSHHVAEGMLRQVPSLDISKGAKRRFDDFVRNKAVPSQRIPEWVGIDSESALDQILGRGEFPMEGSGELRKRLVNAMSSAQFRDRGFPSYLDTLEAVNDPRLAGQDVGSSGLVMFEGQPGAPLIRETGHSSYSHDIPGEYIGGLADPVPLEVMFPKTVGRLMEEGKTNIPRSFQMSHQWEMADDEWLEGIMRYLQENLDVR